MKVSYIFDHLERGQIIEFDEQGKYLIASFFGHGSFVNARFASDSVEALERLRFYCRHFGLEHIEPQPLHLLYQEGDECYGCPDRYYLVFLCPNIQTDLELES